MQSNAAYDRLHVRAQVIQRRQALRRQKQEQKADEYRRRAKVAGFLTDMDSLREESLRVRTPCTTTLRARAHGLSSLPS